MIATPREASGSASGGSMTIFAGGSLPVSGMTCGGLQLSVAFCAAAFIGHNRMATGIRKTTVKRVYLSFAIFSSTALLAVHIAFPRMQTVNTRIFARARQSRH
jgi:hypothetical protein